MQNIARGFKHNGEEKTLLIVALLLITLDSAQQLNEYHFWRGIVGIHGVFGKSKEDRSAMLCVKKKKERGEE